MISLIRTNSRNKEFIELVKHLDAELMERDGDEHAFYLQFNKLDAIRQVVVAYENNKPVGCGAFKEFSDDSAEIKRMYTLPESRGKGIASKILFELEQWARESGYKTCVLETGTRQPEAIALYRKNGYKNIPNYGQYADVKNSLCFAKELID